MSMSKVSASLPSIPFDDATVLDSQVSVMMHEINNSSSVSECLDAKDDSQKVNINQQNQLSLRMHKVAPTSSPSECFISKGDGHCNISQDAWTYSVNMMSQDERQSIFYKDVDSISGVSDGKESADSENKFKESFGSGYFTCHSNEDETDGIM